MHSNQIKDSKQQTYIVAYEENYSCMILVLPKNNSNIEIGRLSRQRFP